MAIACSLIAFWYAIGLAVFVARAVLSVAVASSRSHPALCKAISVGWGVDCVLGACSSCCMVVISVCVAL